MPRDQTVTSSKKVRRMTDSEKQLAAVARKRLTHKEIKVFVRNPLKDLMINECKREGVNQAQFVEKLIENELRKRGLLE